MSNKIWTVQEIEIATHPSYLKRYPVGDGLTLAVHPSGRMTWERSLTQEGKLRWKTFGVHHPKTDRKYITEIKARSENETFLEKRSDGIIDQRVDTSYTVEDVIKKYLLTVKHPSTNQSYNSVLKILSSLYHKKWIHLTDDIIEQEIYNKIESKEISLVASKECFYAIRRVSRYSLVSVPRRPLR